MKIKIIGLILLISINLVGEAPAVAAQRSVKSDHYQRLIIFGDSYSDNGNVYKLTHGVVPNSARYFQGRFSNGPAWGEYFAEYFNINPDDQQRFIDLAYGGAKIWRPVNETIRGKPIQHYIVPNLSQQIDSYIQEYHGFNQDDLIAVFMGTNDFTPLFRKNSKVFFQFLADQEAEQINRLIQSGAKNIIVFNVRNLTYAPVAQWAKKEEFLPLVGKYLDYLTRTINIFNEQLTSDLNGKPQVFIYDIYGFDNRVFSQIQKGGLSYLFNDHQEVLSHDGIPCYQNYKGNYQTVAGPVCANSEEYFFYDRIHTTRGANYLLAKDVYQQFMAQNKARQSN